MARLRAGLVLALDVILLVMYWIFARINGTTLSERASNVVFFILTVVGIALMASRPRNPIGYLIGLIGLAVQAASTLYEYAALAHRPGMESLPLGDTAGWMSLNLWALTLPCLVLILLVFPDGRFLSAGWRLLGILAVGVNLPVIAANVILGWPNRALLIPMDAGLAPGNPAMDTLFRVYDFWNLFQITALVLALISLLVRFARSRGAARQQLKWVVFGLAVIPVSIVLSEVAHSTNIPLLTNLTDVLDLVSVLVFPVTILIAITRYRLYDIDLIIRRTLLYSLLTLTLGAIYVGAVLGMQAVLTRFIGVETVTVIVFSTLLIAALFQPLRRRFQAAIDRRFYRSKFDAQQTLERFAAHLRSEVDLDEIQRGLIAMVDENLQPEHAELWLLRRKA